MNSYGPPPHPAPHGNPPGGPAPAPPGRPRRKVWKVLLGIIGGGIVLFIALGVAGMAMGYGSGPTRNAVDNTPEKPGRLSALDLRAGDCYNDKQLPLEPETTQYVSTVEVVPCSSPHTSQVIDKITYPAGDKLADVRDTRADADCDKSVLAKMSPEAMKSPNAQMGLLIPTNEITWSRQPVVACIVEHPTSSTSLLS